LPSLVRAPKHRQFSSRSTAVLSRGKSTAGRRHLLVSSWGSRDQIRSSRSRGERAYISVPVLPTPAVAIEDRAFYHHGGGLRVVVRAAIRSPRQDVPCGQKAGRVGSTTHAFSSFRTTSTSAGQRSATGQAQDPARAQISSDSRSTTRKQRVLSSSSSTDVGGGAYGSSSACPPTTTQGKKTHRKATPTLQAPSAGGRLDFVYFSSRQRHPKTHPPVVSGRGGAGSPSPPPAARARPTTSLSTTPVAFSSLRNSGFLL